MALIHVQILSVLEASLRLGRSETAEARREAVIAALFRAEREVFSRRFPSAARARLLVVSSRCPGHEEVCPARTVASADFGSGEIRFLRRALVLPIEKLRGLLRHELGHLVDPTPDAPGAEQRADDLAEAATGERIYYDAEDLETTLPGRWPRPLHLPR